MNLQESRRLEAKNLFFLGYTPTEIASKCSCERQTIYAWIKDGQWAVERYEEQRQYVEAKLGKTSEKIADLITLTIPIITSSVQKIAQNAEDKNEPLTTRELKDLTEIITNLNKLARLELSQPTEIVGHRVDENKVYTPDEILKVLQKDPMLITDYKVIEEPKE